MVETLERRDCPSVGPGGGGGGGGGSGGSSLVGQLTAEVLPGAEVSLTGTSLPNATVYFSGAASGSTTADADGNFSFLATNASLGMVYAGAYDDATQDTETASANIAVDAPTLYVSITGATADTITLAGSISGVDVAEQAITLTGAIADTVVTDDYGNFSVTETIASAGTVQIYTTDAWGQTSSSASLTVQSASEEETPQISLNVLMLPGHQVQLAGVVTGDQSAYASVTLSGAANGSTSADGDGFYSYTAYDASLGTVQAVGVDQAEQSTNVASAEIALPITPSITLEISDMTSDTVTFTGRLTDLDLAGETVNITGADVGSVTTDANGYFTFTTSAAGLGLVSVSVEDFWGETSNTAAVDVTTTPPRIARFALVQVLANSYDIEGHVVGQNMQGREVDFGGLTSLQGQSASIDANGDFTLAVILQQGETGTATAQTSDGAGNQSNVAEFVVS